MPPTVILMRTAQAFHYLPDINHHHKRMKWPDTELTPAGERMCIVGARDLAEQQSSISLVVASPMTRALQTAILVFGRALELPSCADAVVALPTLKETFDYPFNTGSSTDKLKELCAEKNWPVDLTMVEDGWTDMSLQSPYFQASAALRMRARKTRRWLKGKLDELVRAGKENATIALVSHGNFLHWLTDDWEKADDLRHTGWYYCEYREYFFEKSAPASWHDEYRFQPHYPDSRNGVAVQGGAGDLILPHSKRLASSWLAQCIRVECCANVLLLKLSNDGTTHKRNSSRYYQWDRWRLPKNYTS